MCLSVFLPSRVQGQVPKIPCNNTDGTNLALGKPATQSSTKSNLSASNAVNGTINNESQISSTNIEINPYWQVDLESLYNIKGVKVFRQDTMELSDYYIFVSETPFETSTLASLLKNDALRQYHVASNYPSDYYFDFSEDVRGQYIRIQKNGLGSITLKEMYV